MRLKIASRKSDLARWQAVQVSRRLEQHPDRPSVEFIFKASLGDLNQDAPLDALGAKGVFTEDFYQDLKDGSCDLVVHSWKDLPVEARPETQIVMSLPRADVRDIFLVPEEVWLQAVNTGLLRILTSSPRRVYNLKAILPELLPAEVKLEFVPVRGNVPTRLTKMHQMRSGLILAKAGLDRLLLAESEGFLAGDVQIRGVIKDCRFMILPVSVNPPAPAQGALAVEVKAANEPVLKICSTLGDRDAFETAEKEREILHRYGGGCHQKIGVAVLKREYGQVTSLRGQTDSGQVLNQWTLENATPWTPAAHAEKVFPLKAADNNWFARKPVPADIPDLSTRPGLMVARADAWPKTFLPTLDQIVWTAGVKSWIKLASIGVWVQGCADNMGEQEDPGIELLCGNLTWTKLTHAQAATAKDVVTYELEPHDQSPNLEGKTHFFWMSSTSFDRARRLFPQVIQAGYHACGPGATLKHLQAAGLRHPVKVFLGLDQFLAQTLP
jgi:hydroxymethylbilane synthase